ncbi:Ig-like domain-containing protein [Knoellia aerolata]|uniref:Fibronectin-binding protein n=1 Tax=Knoellia aerolata DSM 18566 TaxID=1385519 RepID=A0A0A0JYV4_9MICO|nr:fibronectin type III domain-containing protein [Knoellia aerolata]KGN40726.1 fibronectin-binding protein [Knoellia aerolata DSM 18566]
MKQGQRRVAVAPRGRRGVASVGVVAIAASLLTYAAVTSSGSTVHEADVGDGGVWVSSSAQAKFGRLNTQARQLDAGVSTALADGSKVDILQDGAAVVGVATGNTLLPIDVRTATSEESGAAAPAPLPAKAGQFTPATVDLRGGTIATVDPKTGKVWAQRVDTRDGITSLEGVGSTTKPLATIGGNAVIAVDTRGGVIAASGATGTVLTIAPTGDGLAKPVTVATPVRAALLDLTAVGDTWVLYDPSKDELHVEGRDEPVSAGAALGDGPAYAALQQPGAKADTVVIANATAARAVRLSGGDAADVGGVEVRDQANRSVDPPLVTRPVVLRGCLHAAWAETGNVFYGANCGRTDAVAAGALGDASKGVVRDGVAFRVNRGNIVLNHLDTGELWDLDSTKQKIDNWDSLIPPTKKDDDNDKKDENVVDDQQVSQPPKAMPDNLRVRPGRTSKIHPLDNDTDAKGSILAIDPKDLTAPSASDVTASVSSDGQTVDVTVPANPSSSTITLSYKVSNGKAKQKGAARIVLTVVGEEINTPPRVRDGKADLARTTYPVVSGGRVSASVLGDWRDGESDPLTVDAVDPSTVIDGQSRVGVTAPVKPGPATVEYAVTDGRQSTRGDIDLTVLDLAEPTSVPPRTQPDVVRAVLGKPVQLEPLGNDIPGADPGDPDARMRLAGEVAPSGPLDVDTNLTTGVVTVTPNGLGTTELAYAAQSGGTVSPGRIRIDVVEPGDPEAPPVAVPDSASLRDQAPSMIDALANDYSPRADVIVTQSATVAGDSTWLRATVYQGRWVRIEALEPSPISGEGSRQGTVQYAISDGTKRTTGTINVVQRPPLPGASPTVEDDRATVREGDSVSVGVLDNDTMADGIPLVLAPDSVKVVGGGEARAFASGNLVRYVPEFAGLTAPKDVVIEYAAYAEGAPERAKTGRLTVTVNPLPTRTTPNQAPIARSFSGSVTSGESVTLTIPATGVDPDGDSVTLRGIVGKDADALDLTHGRVVSVGPSTIRYEGYPNSAGTELIRYEVQDRFGATSQAFVRVGVVRPGDPQPPVAVEDEVVAAPGKKVTAHVLRNDLIARGDAVRMEHEDLNPGATQKQWTVDEDDDTISTVAPQPDAATHQFVYGIDNGIFDPSRTTLLVRGQVGFVNPPIAQDDVAKPAAGETTALVDALVNDTDIDSDPATLKVVEVLSPHARIEAGKVRVTLLDHAHTVPYVIEDEDEARAMALIFVPPGDKGAPFVVDAALIEMDQDSTRTVTLRDYVKSPRNKVIGITAAATVSASPGQFVSAEAEAEGSDAVRLTSRGGYIGPAALMLEVSDQESGDDKDVRTAYVSVPVQVGPKVPLLRCPDAPIVLAAGGRAREVDIPTYCRAWLPVGTALDDFEFTAKWEPQPDGADLQQAESGGRLVTLSAGGRAPSGTGAVSVTSPGMPSVTFPVRVLGRAGDGDAAGAGAGAGLGPDGKPLPVVGQPRLRPIRVDGLNEGESESIDVSRYLDSPLEKPSCSIAAAQLESGTGIEVSRSGCTLTLRATSQPSPNATVSLLVADGPGRQAAGRVTITMRGKPTAPTGVSAVADRIAGGQARVSWVAPGYDGGVTISHYTVRWGGGSPLRCTSSPCTVTGLTNGKDYTFTVVASNAVGDSPPSAASNVVQPDTKPEATSGVGMLSRGDGTLAVGWSPAPNKGSAITKYVVRLVPTSSGASARTVQAAGTATRAAATGLDNNTPYSVAVQAWNKAGAGPFGPAVQMQSAGTPPAVSGVNGATRGPGAGFDSESITVSWNQQTNPNGPPLKHYTVYRNVDGGGWTQIGRVGAQTRTLGDTIPYDGRRYGYSVTATNGADLESPQGTPWTYTSVGVPSNPSVGASTPNPDKSVVVSVQVGQPRAGAFQAIRWRGGGKSGTHACGCAPGTTVTFTLPNMGIDPLTIKARTVNTGGRESSEATSGQVQPYGPTLEPTNVSASVNGRTITWRWNLRTNGRPIDQVQISTDGGNWRAPDNRESHSQTFGYSEEHGLRVRAHSVDGWSGATTGVRATTVPEPKNPEIYNVRFSAANYIDFDIRDFPGNTSWTINFNHKGYSGSFTSASKVNVGPAGNGYTWGGNYFVEAKGGDLVITMSRAGSPDVTRTVRR